MKPTNPDGLPGKKIVFAENQPEYIPLPSTVEDAGEVWSRWELTDEERAAVVAGACIELRVSTFGHSLQPLYMRVQGVEKLHEDESTPS